MITFPELGKHGRLGNQLFQIASTLGIGEKLNKQVAFPNWMYNICFNIPKDYFENAFPPKTHYYNEETFNYCEFDPNRITKLSNIQGECEENIALHGYFQCEKYWVNIKDKIKEYFAFKDYIHDKCLEILKDIKSKNTFYSEICSIHFRFGDYVNNRFYVDLKQTNYYVDAINYMMNNGATKFLIFSDDIEQAEKAILDIEIKLDEKLDCVFIKGLTSIQDMCLMSMCDASIIANSSFSWWGAYLGLEKLVIAPKDWFGKDSGLNSKDIYTDNMIIL